MSEVLRISPIVKIEDEMQGAYLDYAMSVIVGRALPDVRDGLKPVHRRVLFAMNDLGNVFGKPYKKSARVVGDVIGKYHPHGDSAVYETIVRMAQDFSLRYPIIDGQGNFGSIDGDPPAAMRYTEIRMSKIAAELLMDLDKETVDFGPNYDESLTEPLVLPSRIPNLLINGSTGIAVGMATNIPPHCLSEVIAATLALIKNPELTTDDLLKFIQGPDFPTAGLLFSGTELKQAYRTGRGSVMVRAKAEIETWKNGDRERIIVTELPFQVNKARVIERIADLVREKRIEGISDLRDESDRIGMRIVIELKKGEIAQIVLNQLYKLTQLQDSYSINLLAIHKGQPKTFQLRDLLWAFVEHRKDVVARRTQYILKKSEQRAHLLLGLKKTVENLDLAIRLIRSAQNAEGARLELRKYFELSELQANAVLEMRLQRLTALERDKILLEHEQILKTIEELKRILSSEVLVFEVITRELQEVLEQFGDERRTQLIRDESSEFNEEDLIASEDTLIVITHSGYIKRSSPNLFKSQKRGGRGVKGMKTGDEDFVIALYRCNTLGSLLCFTNRGRVYSLKVQKVPEAERMTGGKAIVNLIPLQPGEKIKAILPVQKFTDNEFVTMVTKRGLIKKTALSEFEGVRSSGIVAISTDENDQLISARITNGKNHIFLSSQNGMCIRFDESEVRSMGRGARGVMGMNLDEKDSVVSMDVLPTDSVVDQVILTMTENGFGKKTSLGEFRIQSRGGMGVINMRTTHGSVIGSRQVLSGDDVVLVTNKGQMIRITTDEISEQGRVTQGVKLISLSQGESLVNFETIADFKDSGS